MRPIEEIVTGLIKACGSAEAVSERLDEQITGRGVQMHASGERAPSEATEKMYRELYAKLEEKVAAGAENRTTLAFDGSRSTVETIVDLARRCEAILHDAENDVEASYRDKAGAVHALKSTLRDLAKLRGELEPTEASIMRTPAYARLRDEILGALADYPDAAKAVLARWEALKAN